jgi:NAD(P)-dependent dehydrogenase (short-subunit alcohol dehydrogenase family)
MADQDRGWAGVMTVNVQSPFTLARDLLPQLKAAANAEDPARIINIGSIDNFPGRWRDAWRPVIPYAGSIATRVGG